MRLADLQDPSGSDEWQLLLFDRLERLSRLTSDIDTRLRRSERRDAIQQTLRSNRIARGAVGDKHGDSHWIPSYLNEFVRRKADEEVSELRKEAEEAGLSPGAYMDDEIIEADEPDESEESQQGS
jgi:hypothetical protein